MPDLDYEDESTAHRSSCPCCVGGVVTVKGGNIEHSSPTCDAWQHSTPEAFFEEVKRAERRAIANGKST